MVPIQTNRDFYLAIAELGEQYKDSERDLEEYLRAVWFLGAKYCDHQALSPSEFFQVISDAFTVASPGFAEQWRKQYRPWNKELTGFEAWESAIKRQVVDLREMAEKGVLQNEYRYFGVSAPRGSYWYNFDPVTFLECATAGSFQGWEPGDATGRNLVPGPVATLNERGEVISCDPRELQRPVVNLDAITWDQFVDFLWSGQSYE